MNTPADPTRTDTLEGLTFGRHDPPALEHHVLGLVHMAQHRVGMATRVELARFEELMDENAVLARALAGAQQRSARQTQDHTRQLEALQSELVRVRGQAMAVHSMADGLRQDLQALRETVPQLDSRQALEQRSSAQGVKDPCKRTGKRCVFVQTPSRAALERALADVVRTP